MLTQVKVATFSVDLSNSTDLAIEESIEEAVASLTEQVGENDKFGSVQVAHSAYVEDDGSNWLLVTVTLTYEEYQAPRPELGTGRRKVTSEVFDYIKAQANKGVSDAYIAEEFDYGISESTVAKIRRSYSFSDYCYSN
jgi:hypothetical protein